MSFIEDKYSKIKIKKVEVKEDEMIKFEMKEIEKKEEVKIIFLLKENVDRIKDSLRKFIFIVVF